MPVLNCNEGGSGGAASVNIADGGGAGELLPPPPLLFLPLEPEPETETATALVAVEKGLSKPSLESWLADIGDYMPQYLPALQGIGYSNYSLVRGAPESEMQECIDDLKASNQMKKPHAREFMKAWRTLAKAPQPQHQEPVRAIDHPQTTKQSFATHAVATRRENRILRGPEKVKILIKGVVREEHKFRACLWTHWAQTCPPLCVSCRLRRDDTSRMFWVQKTRCILHSIPWLYI